MIMEAESLRQIGPAAEYGPHNILWKQRGVCDCIRMYVLLYSTILFHSIHAEFMHVLVLYKTYKQAVRSTFIHKYTLKPK